MRKRNVNPNQINNQKKEKPSYAKMFKEQMKKEAEMNSNKSHISNNKNSSKMDSKNIKEEKKEVKHNVGINFENLSDWDNIVYPGDNEIKQMLSNNKEINVINNENNINIINNNNDLENQNEFQNNIINQIKEDNEDDSDKEQLEHIQHNMNNANNIYNNLNEGLKPVNVLNEFSVNTSEFTNKNEILNQYDNISLGTYNLDNNNNVINNNLVNVGKKNQNLFNDNIVSQIKPLDFGSGLNDINNVIKEEDSLENEDKNTNEIKDKNDNKFENNNNNNIKNNIEFDDLKAQRDIMEQMEEEMNLSMNQMNELAGNNIGNISNKWNNNKNKNKIIKKEDNKNKKKPEIKNNNQKKVDNKIINDKTKKNIIKNENNNNLNANNKNNFNNNINNNMINNKNNEIPLNNLNNNINDPINKFNPNNFSFKPTNIQQVSAEEVNAFIQKNQQKNNTNNINNNNNNINKNPPKFETNQKIVSPINPSLNQPQINTNINPNINININPNIPIQSNMPPMYPSPYPIILPQNQNPQLIYGVPYGMYPGTGYPIPVQNQFGPYPNPQFDQNFEVKNEKKKVNYKPKSLKEYKQKYNNGIKEHRGGLGANIGGEEWEHKKEQNLKVKKYSEMIKNQNKDKENNIKKKSKIKNELNEQLYDSLSDEVLEDEPKEKNKEINNTETDNKNQEINKEDKDTKRPESNKVRYLMQLKKDKQKEKENKSKDNKIKQGKYSKYKKIVIESIDKHPDPNEKKMGKIYTTYKPPMQRRPSTKEKNNLVKQNNNKQRSQSTGLKAHAYKKNNNNYDDELTKKFMSPVPNDYNGYANTKAKDNNFMSPTFEIENLLQKKEQYDSKIKEIKNFLKM